MSSLLIDNEDPRIQGIQALFDRKGNKAYSRTTEALTTYLTAAGWEIQEPGIIQASKWMGTPDWYDATDAKMMELYGVLVKKV